jgi:hypothetical protein
MIMIRFSEKSQSFMPFRELDVAIEEIPPQKINVIKQLVNKFSGLT